MKNDLVILVVDDDKLHYEVLSRIIRKSSLKIDSIGIERSTPSITKCLGGGEAAS